MAILKAPVMDKVFFGQSWETFPSWAMIGLYVSSIVPSPDFDWFLSEGMNQSKPEL